MIPGQGHTHFPDAVLSANRADFNLQDFEVLLEQHGLNLILEETMRCPCNIEANGQPLVTCTNCYGTGWLFNNPREARGVFTSLAYNQKLQQYSEINTGTAVLTIRHDDRLAWMDRITVVDGEDIFFEMLYIVPRTITDGSGNRIYLAMTNYDVKEVMQIYYFMGDKQPLLPLDPSQYKFTGRVFQLLDSQLFPTNPKDKRAISIRYKHLPTYHVLEIPHNIRNTRQFTPVVGQQQSSVFEDLKRFPVNLLLKKAHYLLGNKKFLNIPEGGTLIKESITYGAPPSWDFSNPDNSQNL